MRVNNQVRDSHLDLPADQVNSFYEAMKALGDILEANCYGFKMEDGKLLHTCLQFFIIPFLKILYA